jgi:hypothetical protein
LAALALKKAVGPVVFPSGFSKPIIHVKVISLDAFRPQIMFEQAFKNIDDILRKWMTYESQ